MAITLTPEQEEQVRHIAERRGFDSPETYLTALLMEESFPIENAEEISKLIDEGWEESERGEFLTSEQVRAELENAKREFYAKRSVA